MDDNKLSPEDTKRHRHQLRCLIVGLILFILFLIGGSLLVIKAFVGFGSSKNDVPIPTASTTQSNVNSSPTYPNPKACSQVITPNSPSPSISPNDPGLKENVQNHTYPIYGYEEEDLRVQMTTCGPKYEGESFDAVTTYTMNWDWNLTPTNSDCRISDPVVGINIDIYLPSWDAPNNVQYGLINKWQIYLKQVDDHENTHKQIELDGAASMLSALQSEPAYATCDEANDAATTLANEIFHRTDVATSAYDDETNHGQTTGAVFP